MIPQTNRAGATPPPPLLDSISISGTRSPLKVIKSGNYYELYIAQIPFKIGSNSANLDKKYGNRATDKIQIAKSSAVRARNHIRRLINNNFYSKNTRLITLTFKNNKEFDISSVRDCYHQYSLFMRRLYRAIKIDRHLTVVEYQKRGAVHYHILVNSPYIPQNLLSDIWGLGFVSINKAPHLSSLGVYLAKYFVKSYSDDRFKGVRRIYSSKNLDKYYTFYGVDALNITKGLIGRPVNFKSSYVSCFCGVVRYYEWFIEGG